MRIMYNIYKKGPYKGVIDILKLTVNVGQRFGEHTATVPSVNQGHRFATPPLGGTAERRLFEYWVKPYFDDRRRIAPIQ